jgi:formate dehydrogenase subunit delta
MNVEHLVTMANQIGTFFEAEAERGEAANDIANHLKKFWDPRMRRQIVAYVEEENGLGLNDIVLEAIRLNRDSLCGGSQAILADDRWVGPSGASDAG